MVRILKHTPYILALALLTQAVGCTASATGTQLPTLTNTTPIIEPATLAPSSTPKATSMAEVHPTMTATPQPPASATATSTLTPWVLPDLLLNVSSKSDPLLRCHQQTDVSGQIWTTSSPYTAVRALLVDDQTGFYDPAWSPDRKWIAYIASSPRNAQQVNSPDGRSVNYPKSDSIWLMRPDGSDRRQIGNSFQRTEAFSLHNTGESCDLVGGIVSLRGLSADGQWLAFVYLSPVPDAHTELHILNLATANDDVVAQQVFADVPVWQHAGNKLASIVTGPDQVEYWDFGAAGLSHHTISPPPMQPSGYRLVKVEWDQGDQSLLVVGKASYVPSDVPATLWRVDLSTQQWQKVMDIGPVQDLSLNANQNGGALCKDGELSRRDPVTWNLVQSLTTSVQTVCTNLREGKTAEGQSFVGFVDGQSLRQVWVLDQAATFSPLQQVINADSSGISGGLSIINIAWP